MRSRDQVPVVTRETSMGSWSSFKEGREDLHAKSIDDREFLGPCPQRPKEDLRGRAKVWDEQSIKPKEEVVVEAHQEGENGEFCVLSKIVCPQKVMERTRPSVFVKARIVGSWRCCS